MRSVLSSRSLGLVQGLSTTSLLCLFVLCDELHLLTAFHSLAINSRRSPSLHGASQFNPRPFMYPKCKLPFLNCWTEPATTRELSSNGSKTSLSSTHNGSCTHGNRSNEPNAIAPTKKKSPESNFWYALPEGELPDPEDIVPCNADMYGEGPLPCGAYRKMGTDNRWNCLFTVGVDLSLSPRARRMEKDNDSSTAALNPSDVVRGMQVMIDHGFTSFQLATRDTRGNFDQNSEQKAFGVSDMQHWGEKHVYAKLREETPKSVMSNCLLTTIIDVPPVDAGPFGDGATIRNAVSDSLLRVGGDSLDVVQVRFCKGSPYYLDVLDVLQDLQRKGTVESISGLDFSPPALKSLVESGFHLYSNQMICNILDQRAAHDMQSIYLEANTKFCPSSPIGGGLLSDAFRTLRMSDPYPWELSASQQRHLETIKQWAATCPGKKNSYWQLFRKCILGNVNDVACKHRVSMASVALRWCLQLDNVGSVVVASRVGRTDSANRSASLREAFTFALDDEDLEKLDKAASQGDFRTPVPRYNAKEVDEKHPKINFSDQRLWL